MPDHIVAPPLGRGDVDVHVPDGTDPAAALARTTVLGVAAHPDDLDLAVPGLIGECRDDPDRWFAGVVCTDGSGSARGPATQGLSAAELGATRRREQRDAADVGGYGIVVQLGRPSAELRRPERRARLVGDLADLVATARPQVVVTHDLADRHLTHQAVGLAVVEACRRVPASARPLQLVGVEGWRGLTWLGGPSSVALDATGHEDLARRLAAAHASQLEVKGYDAAFAGRRRANATLAEQRLPDTATEVALAMDLTPLLDDPALDPVAFLAERVERFRDEVTTTLGGLGSL